MASCSLCKSGSFNRGSVNRAGLLVGQEFCCGDDEVKAVMLGEGGVVEAWANSGVWRTLRYLGRWPVAAGFAHVHAREIMRCPATTNGENELAQRTSGSESPLPRIFP